jgi:hypothetical protein
MKKGEILEDGSKFGETFSGDKYKGEYPSPLIGKETYRNYYNRVEKLRKVGFHLGDLSWEDYHTYCYGFDGGQYIQDYTIGKVPDNAWREYEDE